MQLKGMYRAGALACVLAGASALCGASVAGAQNGGSAANMAEGQDANDAKINAIPLDRLVTSTCRQAWHLSGENQDAFFDIVERLTDLSAHNRNVTLPNTAAAGSRAGQWIRTQALKDPDQLLYAVVDHAVMYSISKGTSTPVNGAAGADGTGK